jgi:hypothetical protein
LYFFCWLSVRASLCFVWLTRLSDSGRTDRPVGRHVAGQTRLDSQSAATLWPICLENASMHSLRVTYDVDQARSPGHTSQERPVLGGWSVTKSDQDLTQDTKLERGGMRLLQCRRYISDDVKDKMSGERRPKRTACFGKGFRYQDITLSLVNLSEYGLLHR